MALRYSGPSVLPFGHGAVRVHIDNLFEEGLLTPVEWDWAEALGDNWTRVGLRGKGGENSDLRFDELGKTLLQACPDTNGTPQSWLVFAYRYGQARMLWTQISATKRSAVQKDFTDLCLRVNEQFYSWLQTNYGGIFNYPPSSPLMVPPKDLKLPSPSDT